MPGRHQIVVRRAGRWPTYIPGNVKLASVWIPEEYFKEIMRGYRPTFSSQRLLIYRWLPSNKGSWKTIADLNPLLGPNWHLVVHSNKQQQRSQCDKTDFQKTLLLKYDVKREMVRWGFLTRVTLADGRSLHSRTGALGRGQLHRCTVSSVEDGHTQVITVGSKDVVEKFRTLLQLLR
ncbi:hypothetical protein CYMTET_11368 [Cymbomonas tetramitiformis]|uniref:Uncharacterized protein n=1 Tax=Cymbomonas tetramitiformis TaxID=36881 RepID=A0AAE0GMG4_9CHLO|nr:hypothetical protein CYMTET_11368 [Cymbomonas tetramitiformis]